MFARLPGHRKAVSRLFAILALTWLGACVALPGTGSGGDGGPRIVPGAPVQVALMVPSGTGDAGNDELARNLENAARLAISDLDGVAIDLRVYSTGNSTTQAANAAARAVNEGALVLLGPLFADAANAAGVAVAPSGVNVLAFSNNASIAGGNVFILGPTFRTTAERLVRYGAGVGVNSYVVVHAEDLQGNVGRDAIVNAVRQNGGTVAGVIAYPLSQQAIQGSAQGIAQAVTSTGADAVFLTAGANADLPLLATSLPAAGLSPQTVRYMGLTRWNVSGNTLALPGLQGGLFAVPDQNMTNIFESRYRAAYGQTPHPLAGLAYDGIAAIGALVAQGRPTALTRASLTQAQGFQGTAGIFRLLPDGTNERGLAVATIRNNQMVIIDPAPRSFGRAGS